MLGFNFNFALKKIYSVFQFYSIYYVRMRIKFLEANVKIINFFRNIYSYG